MHNNVFNQFCIAAVSFGTGESHCRRWGSRNLAGPSEHHRQVGDASISFLSCSFQCAGARLSCGLSRVRRRVICAVGLVISTEHLLALGTRWRGPCGGRTAAVPRQWRIRAGRRRGTPWWRSSAADLLAPAG